MAMEGPVAAAAVASLAPLIARVQGDCTAAVADIAVCTSLEPSDRITRALHSP